MIRPSYKELNTKIKQAKEAIAESRISILEPVDIAVDAIKVGYLFEDIQKVLADILNEISPKDYAGQSPPKRSYKEKIKGCELFAFAWQSNKFGCEIYLKFALKNNVIWLVSLH
jgi:hypothetical protein